MTDRLSSKERPERRRLLRFIVADSRATSSVVDVVLRDLSSQGMSVESRRPLRVGASYPFRVRQRGEFMEVHGVVKWCKLQRMIDIGGGESQTLYRAGIAFAPAANDSPVAGESVGASSPAGAEAPGSAGATSVTGDREVSTRLNRLRLEDRKRIQAGLADLVDDFIKSLPSDS